MVDNLTKSPMKRKSADENSGNSATKYHKHLSLSGNLSKNLGNLSFTLGPKNLSDVLQKKTDALNGKTHMATRDVHPARVDLDPTVFSASTRPQKQVYTWMSRWMLKKP